ncbi:GNAT family N-acetyltransferase [Pelagibius sp.]|uniref:GNAT family N-acetyltransferase n=1 Tax=Pelagibius sp. TaxID=1931238 RepID=UPI002620C4F8|nr:GNAT family protein [Pelagibius sp.]
MPDDPNPTDLPLGAPLPGWTARPRPPRSPMEGRTCRIEPLDPAVHGADLFEAYRADRQGRVWTYLPAGPFATMEDFHAWLTETCLGDDPFFHAVIDRQSGKALGVASYLRIEPAVGVIEVGYITFSPALQRTVMSTEAMYLMMRRVFDELGYRRYEWKCNALNAPSCTAAERLGFTFEGIFRQATISKGRNRDTAWYSILDKEWPRANAAFEAWLDPANFDAEGRQIRSLAAIRMALNP